MEIYHLRYFLKVAEELSFSKAAAKLKMTQPPLSKRISDLENEFGIKLFNRSTNPIQLTSAGKSLIPFAEMAVEKFDNTVDYLSNAGLYEKKVIRFGFPPDISYEVLRKLSDKLNNESIEFEFIEATTTEQEALLKRDEIDVGVVYLPISEKGLWLSEPLSQTLGVVFSNQHPLNNQEHIQLSELSEHSLVMFKRDNAVGLYDKILGFCKTHGYEPKFIEHGIRIAPGLLIARDSVTFNSSTSLLAGSSGLIWKPLFGDPLKWSIAVACRKDEYKLSNIKIAIKYIVFSLKESHWNE